jgi:hypothetical protein
MIRTRNVSLSTTSPTELTITDIVQSSNTLVVQNTNDSGYVYIGTSAVSSSNYGIKLYPGQAFTIELSAYTHVYAVCSANTMTAAVMVIERAI